DFSETGVPRFNSYVAFAVAVYVAKVRQLYETIAESLNNSRYLVYAQSARAIIESTATARYYSRHSDLVALKKAKERGTVPPAILEKAYKAIDRLVRGNRFSWDAFVSHRFHELSNVPDEPDLAQVNVQTCLDKWCKDEPKLRSLYA